MMKTWIRILVVLLFFAALGGVLVLKERRSETKEGAEDVPLTSSVVSTAEEGTGPALPRLVDLGADKCVPCKMMIPVLASLSQEYAGVLSVEFIDVWKDEAAGEAYGVRIIPTQIFYDSTGQERFRHEGFLSKDDILAKWEELGVHLAAQSGV